MATAGAPDGLTEAVVLEALKRVIDPELGVNIVDLGLIYDVQVARGLVRVKMTLTTPGCPMHEALSEGARRAIRSLADVSDAIVEVVWEPAWNPDMMTPEGKRLLSQSPAGKPKAAESPGGRWWPLLNPGRRPSR